MNGTTRRHRRWAAGAAATLGATLLTAGVSVAADAAEFNGEIDAIAFGLGYDHIGSGATKGPEQLGSKFDLAHSDLYRADIVHLESGGKDGGDGIALTKNGTVITWGENSTGIAGNGGTDAKPTATALDTTGSELDGKVVTTVAISSQTAYALTSDGSVFAWGEGSEGQIGNGARDDVFRPTRVPVTGTPLDGQDITGLFSTADGAMVQTASGDVYGWGLNATILDPTSNTRSFDTPRPAEHRRQRPRRQDHRRHARPALQRERLDGKCGRPHDRRDRRVVGNNVPQLPVRRVLAR